METVFYHWSMLDKLDCLAEHIAWHYGKAVRSVNFKVEGIFWKLVVRAYSDNTMWVCYTPANTPREALEIFFQKLGDFSKMGIRWHVSKY